MLGKRCVPGVGKQQRGNKQKMSLISLFQC